MTPLPRYIEIETSRFCNRTCGWCPNGHSDSRRTQELMPWEMFEGLLNELSNLGYRSWLALHNYNEPLANPRILNELATVQRLLPGCRPSIFTNGDKLTPGLLTEIANVGTYYLRVTLYPSANQTARLPSEDQLLAWLRFKGIDVQATWTIGEARQGLAATAQLGTLSIEVISPNLSRYNWRGGTAPAFAQGERTQPCFMTTHSASIDYQGRLKMCCNVYPEAPGHEAYVIGTLRDSSFIKLWESKRFQTLREAHARADWLGSTLCSQCGQSLPKSQLVQIQVPIRAGEPT